LVQEVLEHGSGVVVDEGGDPLDTASSGESSDRGLGDALDVGSAGLLLVSLGADFSESFSSFSCHFI